MSEMSVPPVTTPEEDKPKFVQQGAVWRPVGTIQAPSGLLILADADILDKAWQRRGEAPGHWAVDFSGRDAKEMARRSAQDTYKLEELADGTWRVHVPDHSCANTIRHQTEQHIEWRGGTVECKVYVAPKETSQLKLKDSIRGKTAGVSNVHQFSAAAVQYPLNPHEKVNMVLVEELVNTDGRVLEVRIKLPKR